MIPLFLSTAERSNKVSRFNSFFFLNDDKDLMFHERKKNNNQDLHYLTLKHVDIHLFKQRVFDIITLYNKNTMVYMDGVK